MSRAHGSKAQLHAALHAQHGADALVDFSGANAFLSNFYKRALSLDGVSYATAEHAFQAQKSTCPAERMRIASASTAAVAKKLGREVASGANCTPRWFSGARDEAMRKVLAAKVSARDCPAASLASSRKRRDWRVAVCLARARGAAAGNGQAHAGGGQHVGRHVLARPRRAACPSQALTAGCGLAVATGAAPWRKARLPARTSLASC